MHDVWAISQSDAETKVKYRASIGNYKTVADLINTGADRKKIEAKKTAIDFYDRLSQ